MDDAVHKNVMKINYKEHLTKKAKQSKWEKSTKGSSRMTII